MSVTRFESGIGSSPKVIAGLVIFLLAASLMLVAIAPLFMPDSYSVIVHSVSESAGQGIRNAWVARLGFLSLAFAVLLLGWIADDRWGPWGRLSFRMYSILLIAAAVFAHRPWEEVPFDEFEDFLHSVGATGMGLMFTAGVLMVTFRRGPGSEGARVFDWIAILAAPVLPMIMFNNTGIAGLVQRILFLIGYLWYAAEAIRSTAIDGSVATSVDGSGARADAGTGSV